jgi:WD40 repeat protein
MFRVWDVRTFTTVQTFNCPLNEINCFTLTHKPKRIIAGGRRLVFYDYDEPTDHHLADDQACLCVLYNSVFYTFITAHPKCIKVWDATNGKLISVFRDLTTRDITCICLDKRKRKLFVGDSKGRVFSINIKNGARMKKFKRHKADVSSLYYWGDRNILISSSWDNKVRLYDDSTSESEGSKRYTMKKHKQSCNFIDFKPSHSLCASASDDESVIIYNYGSYRQEGILQPHESEVKICKFLNPYDCLVSADLEGKLYFWAVTPSSKRNECLAIVKDDNESEVGTIENFPIRGMDFDAVNMILYTGDEMGFMHKWDCSVLLTKLQKFTKKDKPQQHGSKVETEEPIIEETEKATFITGMGPGGEDPLEFKNEDIQMVHRWKAHTDGINWVTFVEDLNCIASCSFDCHVYMWNPSCQFVGSLVLGLEKKWDIIIDKSNRNQEESNEAEDMLMESEETAYDKLFAIKKKDGTGMNLI